MRVPQSYIQRCKVAAHVFQGLLIFIAGCIMLAVLTKGGQNGGPVGYYFALCFLTLPALIYLVMTPMWSRAARFANAYAFVALDGLYTLLWFVAFIALAFYNSSGLNQGAKDAKLKDSDKKNCTHFAWGPEAKCKLSRACFGFGVVIWILFGVTAAISAYYLIKFRKDGSMPYESMHNNAHHAGGDSAKDNAWSTEIDHPHSDDEEDRHTERGGNQEEDEYALLHSTETDEGRHPGRPLSWGEDSGRYARDPVPPYVGYDDHSHGASALSPGGYEEYRRETGPADHGGAGYSFSGGGGKR